VSAGQDIFNRVAKHLLTQNARAVTMRFTGATGDSSSIPVCRYRTPEGLRCAIGCLISDESYSSALEGHSATDDGVLEALEASGVPMRGLGFSLRDLQDIHDNHQPREWRDLLAKFAEDYGLTFDAGDTLPAPPPDGCEVAS
jgi:hypothetical protein